MIRLDDLLPGLLENPEVRAAYEAEKKTLVEEMAKERNRPRPENMKTANDPAMVR
jgi:hypothetical protein